MNWPRPKIRRARALAHATITWLQPTHRLGKVGVRGRVMSAWLAGYASAMRDALTVRSERYATFQSRVVDWIRQCFGPADLAGVRIRAHRFVEEANELGQAAGVTREEAHQLVDYVYGRPVGVAPQEVGGVMVTLAGLCHALRVNQRYAAESELTRCWDKIETIRAKNLRKKADSALPGGPPSLGPLLSYHYSKPGTNFACCEGHGRMYGPDVPAALCEHGANLHWHT